MAGRKYVVSLSRTERAVLEELIQNEAPRSRRVKHAKILLHSDVGHGAAKVAAWAGVGHSTVERTRQCHADSALEAALTDKRRPGGLPMLEGRRRASASS